MHWRDCRLGLITKRGGMEVLSTAGGLQGFFSGEHCPQIPQTSVTFWGLNHKLTPLSGLLPQLKVWLIYTATIWHLYCCSAAVIAFLNSGRCKFLDFSFSLESEAERVDLSAAMPASPRLTAWQSVFRLWYGSYINFLIFTVQNT